MTIHVLNGLVQGTEEWLKARCGLLTASVMDKTMTPKMAPADNDKSRALMFDLLAQRITKHVEPSFISDDMLRGLDQEHDARAIYADEYAAVEEVGFITNDALVDGEKIGFSPDFLVGKNGQGEIKCPRQKKHLETLLSNAVPPEHLTQVHTGLWVTGREWCDFISHCAGLPMFTLRVYADVEIQKKLKEAAEPFLATLNRLHREYERRLSSPDFRLVPTTRMSDEIISSHGDA